MFDSTAIDALCSVLFAGDGAVFALVDGAAVPDLISRLRELDPQHECLLSGEIMPDLAECAPYLVRLDRGARFTQWLLVSAWGRGACIMVTAEPAIRTLRSHFRNMLRVLDPDGRELYFRYYDPRVLRAFLPTCTPDELARFLGPCRSISCDGTDPYSVLRWTRDSPPDAPARARIPVAAPSERRERSAW